MKMFNEAVKIPEEVLEFHRKCLVADIHTHYILNVRYFKKNFFKKHFPAFFYNPWANMIDYPRAKAGGVDLLVTTIYVPGNPLPWFPNDRAAMKMLGAYRNVLRSSGSRIRQALSADEVVRAVESGAIATFPAIEGAHCLEGKLENLHIFYDAGVRMITLAHFISNHAADSCFSPWRPHNGLSAFGRELIHEMNRLGVIIDVAHATDRAFWQILEESACPVLSSHSGLRALNYIERNLSDDMVRAIAASHGLIGIMLHPPYLKRHSLLASIDVVVDHIEKAAELTSPRNVCIGTDMDGYILLPRGFRDVTSMPLLTWKLLQRGFTREDVECILGQNFLRFFSESTRTNAGV